ncbi:enoyl-CoA hydratase/isomerase family protein [Paraburkholderia megapolitana]|nr:enoyl-CoA hydratase/isomerase family protein [Paraburkholderia megapolitana]
MRVCKNSTWLCNGVAFRFSLQTRHSPNTMNDDTTSGTPRFAIRDQIAEITLDRPHHHNRIDPDDLAPLMAHLRTVRTSQECRALVITGTGTQTFSSGYTLSAIVEQLDGRFEAFLDALEQCPVPTICALNGSVYGGATDLALCCDFRIGVSSAQMFMPAARIGLHYYPGGMRRYVTALGIANAKRLFLTGITIDATEMLRIGFLTDLVDSHTDALNERVAHYVDAIRVCEPGVVRSMKTQLNQIAAGERDALISRTDYENSLVSEELRARLAALKR